MPREIALGDAFAPSLVVAFVLSLALFWLLDWVFGRLSGRLNLFHRVWHPPLFRLALFVCVFCSTALLLF